LTVNQAVLLRVGQRLQKVLCASNDLGIFQAVNACLSAQVLSGIFRPADQTNGRECQPVSLQRPGILAKTETPPKAQHPQPLRLKNYWRRQIWRELDQPTTEGARNASCNLSGIKDRWGVARNRAAPFFIFSYD
jgi:hypothetical protein